MTIKQIKKLLIELEEKGEAEYEIGHRGGRYGLSAEKTFEILEIKEEDRVTQHFPPKIGVYCNYLGGGLRGAITSGGYSKEVPIRVVRKIEKFYSACKKRYEEIEKVWAKDPEAFTDKWGELGTKKCRQAGIVSAY